MIFTILAPTYINIFKYFPTIPLATCLTRTAQFVSKPFL